MLLHRELLAIARMLAREFGFRAEAIRISGVKLEAAGRPAILQFAVYSKGPHCPPRRYMARRVGKAWELIPLPW